MSSEIQLLLRTLFTLRESLDPATEILQDPSSKAFHQALKRWTDESFEVPGAIIFPSGEDDAIFIVRLALRLGTPFVCKAGGHSSWSTIGAEGFVLDFSNMKEIEIDTAYETLTAGPGLTVGEVINAVSKAGRFLATGTVNSVGFIPSTIGGGLSGFSSLVGNGADNIVSARVLTADGNVIITSEKSHPELFYAIRGAGQHYGVIISLTVRMFDQSLFGTGPANTVWVGTFVFSTEKAVDVSTHVLKLREQPRCSMLAGVMPMPPALDSVMRVAAIYIGTAEQAKAAIKPLLDAGPLISPVDAEVPYEKVNDLWAAYEGKGGYKAWWAVGFPQAVDFDPAYMDHFIQLRSRIADSVPSARASYFFFEWASPWNDAGLVKDQSAFSHGEVQLFVHMVCSSWNEEGLKKASVMVQEAMEYIRQQQNPSDYTFYGNFSRVQPVEHRYRGRERLRRLKELKMAWDPKGVFTGQFLKQSY